MSTKFVKTIISGGGLMVNEKIREYIIKNRISQRRISRRTGISEYRVYSIFRKKPREMKVEEFLKICRFLDLDPMDFLE